MCGFAEPTLANTPGVLPTSAGSIPGMRIEPKWGQPTETGNALCFSDDSRYTRPIQPVGTTEPTQRFSLIRLFVPYSYFYLYAGRTFSYLLCL